MRLDIKKQYPPIMPLWSTRIQYTVKPGLLLLGPTSVFGLDRCSVYAG